MRMKQAFATNLARLIGRRPQSELAEALGVTQSSVSRWLSGDALPSVDRLAELARHLGVTVDELLHEG